MKKIFITMMAIVSIMKLNAQAFEEGRSYVSVGYGFGNLSQSIIKAAVSGTDAKYSSFGPAFLKYEYGISDKIGIGVNFATLSANVSANASYFDSVNVNYTEKVKYSTTSILGRLNFHMGENDNIDPYFGFGMGYRAAKWTYSSSDPNAPAHNAFKGLSHFGMEITFGCRFLITENIGFYTEVGVAKAIVQLGLCGKF